MIVSIKRPGSECRSACRCAPPLILTLMVCNLTANVLLWIHLSTVKGQRGSILERRCAQAFNGPHTHTDTHAHTRTHTYTHRHGHTRTHTHTHTHTHTFTRTYRITGRLISPQMKASLERFPRRVRACMLFNLIIVDNVLLNHKTKCILLCTPKKMACIYKKYDAYEHTNTW